MKVTLLNYAQNINTLSSDHESLIAKAAAICVDRLDNITKNGKMVALESGHFSILEHLPLTFLVEDVSRALTHQLVRHRIASYSQMSQRYAKVKVNNPNWFVKPETIMSDLDNEQGIASRYNQLMFNIAELYGDMCEAGIPNEDARYILPNACYTSIICSFNARAFVEICEKRLCKKAQWEILQMFTQMKELIKGIYPTIYSLCNPPCKKTQCKEKKPCNRVD